MGVIQCNITIIGAYMESYIGCIRVKLYTVTLCKVRKG